MNTNTYTTQSIDKVLGSLGTSTKTGLSSAEIEKRQAQYGKNELGRSTVLWWAILLRQFKSPFIYLLITAVVLSAGLQQTEDALLILAFIIINTALGFYQEYRSEKTLQLLNKYITSTSTVLRNGREVSVTTSEIVPGDIVIVKTGDKIPADIRIIDAADLEIDESILTGESSPTEKTTNPLAHEPKEVFQSYNIGFSGTIVVAGRGRGVVLATGRETEIGKIAKLAVETRHVSDFEKGIARFSAFILRLVLITLAIVFVANIFLKSDKVSIAELIVFSIALAITVIPEALPIVTTFSLTRGALHLAKNNVVVKRLSSIEDLGGVEVLCSDKTGTLTENKLRVVELSPEARLETLLYANLGSSSANRTTIDPFDHALWEKLAPKQQTLSRHFKRLDDLPFDPNRLRNAVLVQNETHHELIVRGAPEVIFELCDERSKEQAKKTQTWVDEQGQRGRRVLAVAKKIIAPRELPALYGNLPRHEHHLTLLGVVAFADPIKTSAIPAIKEARGLGISVKIITGDSKEVAGAVAQKIGLIDDSSKVLTGRELDAMSLAEQHQAVLDYSVFARIVPEEKYKIIQLLQEKYNVGFLGEGINDTPALKEAGVSIVVQSASDITREAADIVLLEKDLKVIVDGIKQGRAVFENTLKYIRATLSSNFGNLYTVALASLFIDFLPILPIQILLINLLTDLPMIAIATDRVSPKEVSGPKRYNMRGLTTLALVLGSVGAIFDVILFRAFYHVSPGVLQTAWFMGSVLTELAFFFSIRTRGEFWKASRPSWQIVSLTILVSILAIGLPYTIFGQTVIHFVALSKNQLTTVLAIVTGYFVSSEALKLVYYRMLKPTK